MAFGGLKIPQVETRHNIVGGYEEIRDEERSKEG